MDRLRKLKTIPISIRTRSMPHLRNLKVASSSIVKLWAVCLDFWMGGALRHVVDHLRKLKKIARCILSRMGNVDSQHSGGALFYHETSYGQCREAFGSAPLPMWIHS